MAGTHEAAAVAGAVGVVAIVVVGLFVTWCTFRRFLRLTARIRRLLPVDRLLPGPEVVALACVHLRRRWLDARVLTATGSRRQGLAMRRELWLHVDAARAALEAGRLADAPLGDLHRLGVQLRALAGEHDRQLRLLPDPAPADDLRLASAETNRITGCADELARTAREVLRSVSAGGTSHLESLVAREVIAVREGASRIRAVSGR